MKLKNIISFYGGPGTGKSICAGQLTTFLAVNGYCVEYVTEYAKDLTWEKQQNILKEDQLYVLVQQHRKFYRLINQIEYIVTDSPIFLCLLYYNLNKNNMIYTENIFRDLVLDLYSKYNHINIFLTNKNEKIYQSVGRSQNFHESIEISNQLKDLLNLYKIPYFDVETSINVLSDVQDILINNFGFNFNYKFIIK